MPPYFKLPKVTMEFLQSICDESEEESPSVANRSESTPAGNNPDVFDRQSASDLDNVSEPRDIILSVFWKRGKLGAAYYTCDNSELFILNDVVDVHPDFNHLRSLVNQVDASKIITCGGLSEEFMKVLVSLINKESSDEGTTDSSSIQLPNRLHLMAGKRIDLQYESCRRQVLGMRFGFEPPGLSEANHLIFLNSHLDVRAESMVIALGMLLRYLDKFLPEAMLTHDRIPIMFLHHIALDKIVSIDEVTYKALQIFNIRFHPSAFKRSSAGCKEGLSVYGVFNRCKTTMGGRRMREMLTSPSKDLAEINERLDAVEFCARPEHQHVVANLLSCVKQVANVTAILRNILQTRASVANWKALYRSVYNSILIGQICQVHAHNSPLFQKVSRSVTDNVHQVAHNLNRIIDFEQSSIKNQFTVRAGVSSELDRMRQTYSQVPQVLVKVAALELADLPPFIERCSLVYITELGYLLSVPIWKEEASDVTAYQLPNFEVKFLVNKFVHFKTPRCSELDNVLGDIVAMMSGIESQFLVFLIQFIQERMTDIAQAVRMVAELDCVIALAAVATENNYCRPVVVKDRALDIVNGRHPLQELCVDSFVPNDTSFAGPDGLVKILTGPNASGKSVYLKQVALIAYLAHVGSFVPADRATIGVLDHIHSRIQCVESIATRMSAFLLDLKQMSHALYNSTPSSLIVVDEFGKGTTEIDGLSLLTASLLSLVDRGQHCPMVLVSTHFHRLPELLLARGPCPLIHLQYMSYLVENDEIVYLHKMKDGTAGASMAHLAAKAAGLCPEALSRSLQLLNSDAPWTANPDLNITKTMVKWISHMKKVFLLFNEQQEK